MKSQILSIFLFLIIFSCKKETKTPLAKQDQFIEGKAIGLPTIKEIDVFGGEIYVVINEAKVIFPINSVLSKTRVSIQPITNTKANFGSGIRISSHYKNTKIELKYPQNGILPDEFEIYSMQTDSPFFGWKKRNNKIIDSLNHTISIIQSQEKNSLGLNPKGKLLSHSFDFVVGN